MGILILPFFLGALAAFVISIVTIYKQLEIDEINIGLFAYGLLLSIALYGLIVFWYVVGERYWALSPYFSFPFLLLILPVLIGLIMKEMKNKALGTISSVVFISIIFSGIFIILFNGYIWNILEILRLEKHY